MGTMSENDFLRKFSKSIPQFATAVVALSSFAHAQQISIRGTDTLIYLGQRFAAIYSRTSPDTHVLVLGGGSASAITALSSAQTDVAQLEGGRPSLNSPPLVWFPVGVQTLVVYVNEANPIHDLTLGQLRSIFMGEITNWKTLGGADANITLYAGESSTGTLAYFQESVLRGEEPYPFVGKSNTKALLAEIASHQEAIGYGSLGSAPGVKALAIRFGPTSPAVTPTEEAIRSGRYPVTRQIFWAVRRQRSQALEALCRWALSSEGQLVVESVGFEPLLSIDRSSALAKLQNPAGLPPAHR